MVQTSVAAFFFGIFTIFEIEKGLVLLPNGGESYSSLFLQSAQGRRKSWLITSKLGYFRTARPRKDKRRLIALISLFNHVCLKKTIMPSDRIRIFLKTVSRERKI